MKQLVFGLEKMATARDSMTAAGISEPKPKHLKHVSIGEMERMGTLVERIKLYARHKNGSNVWVNRYLPDDNETENINRLVKKNKGVTYIYIYHCTLLFTIIIIIIKIFTIIIITGYNSPFFTAYIYIGLCYNKYKANQRLGP
jgi:hypothetical protein